MSEHDSPEWFSGLVSNSTTSGNNPSTAAGNDTTAKMSSNNASATESGQSTSKDAALLLHLTSLLGSFSLTHTNGGATASSAKPIFFSTKQRTSTMPVPEPISVLSGTDESSVSFDEKGISDKIKAMLTEGIHSTPSANVSNKAASESGRSEGSENSSNAHQPRSTLINAPIRLNDQRDSLSVSHSSEAFVLLQRKAQAQELLIGRLYSDLLQAEERLSNCTAAKARVEMDLAAQVSLLEREKAEWERECFKLARVGQTQVTPAPLPSSVMLAAEAPKRIAPLSPFVGFDGSRKTFVSLHEELHYTKGHNAALREQVARLSAELDAKDFAMTRLGAQLREAYKARAPVIDEERTSALSLQSALKAHERPRSGPKDTNDKQVAIMVDEPLVLELLSKLVRKEKPSRSSSRGTKPPSRSDSTGSNNRRPSPFRKTSIL